MQLFLACDRGLWTPFIFLELFPIRKDTDVPENECHKCGLAYKSHPMKLIEHDGLEAYEKYCLKDFLKYGFVKATEVL